MFVTHFESEDISRMLSGESALKMLANSLQDHLIPKLSEMWLEENAEKVLEKLSPTTLARLTEIAAARKVARQLQAAAEDE